MAFLSLSEQNETICITTHSLKHVRLLVYFLLRWSFETATNFSYTAHSQIKTLSPPNSDLFTHSTINLLVSILSSIFQPARLKTLAKMDTQRKQTLVRTPAGYFNQWIINDFVQKSLLIIYTRA